MIGVAENPDKPLPVVLKPVLDELLSSWLGRHAAYYGVTGPFLANWLMLGTSKLSALDYRLSLPQVARLSEKLRCDPISLLRMTFAGHIRTIFGYHLPGQGSPNMSPLRRSIRPRKCCRCGFETLA